MTTLPDLDALHAMISRFVPVDIGADLSDLTPSARHALPALVGAARVMDEIFLEQVWSGNHALAARLSQDRTPLGQARLRYFLLNKGPWSRLDRHRAFIPDVPAKPPGANFYPEDATREEVSDWLERTSDRTARGFVTTIRRRAGGFRAVPYSVEYREPLARARRLVFEAATATDDPALATYLSQRGEAFRTNDYVESDVAWMALEGSIEPVIGPYEVYEDEWFNAKAAFEAFVTIRDEVETRRLAHFGRHLQLLEDHLPIAARHRNPRLGAHAPIRVVHEIFAAGEANRGIQTAAFNLPNDERIIREHGSKRVMLKNVQQAKFEHVLRPIADRALAPRERAQVSFDAFFTHVLLHELMHGLGPHDIEPAGRRTTVRQELAETYSAVEEAKADISGLWALWVLADRGLVDDRVAGSASATVLASMFRSLRFGIDEAHGRGVSIQLDALLDAGGAHVRADGTFEIDEPRFRAAATDLTATIMTLQAEGDAERARELVERSGRIRPEVQRVLDRLSDLPVDIAPRFVTPGMAGSRL